MKIIAKREDAVLEYINENEGRVINIETGEVGPTHSIFSILARGYWDEYKDPIEYELEVKKFL